MVQSLLMTMLDHTWMIMWIVLICMSGLYAIYKLQSLIAKSSKKENTEERQIIF